MGVICYLEELVNQRNESLVESRFLCLHQIIVILTKLSSNSTENNLVNGKDYDYFKLWLE